MECSDKKNIEIKYKNINIVGAPGSGTSTLGAALAGKLKYGFADADDFYWVSTDPPFKEKVQVDARQRDILSYLNKYEGTVTSGSVCGWGQELENYFDLIIFISIPTDIRLERIKQRDNKKFGSTNPEFLIWAGQYEEGFLSGRSRQRHENWLLSRQCKVLRISEVDSIENYLDFLYCEI